MKSLKQFLSKKKKKETGKKHVDLATVGDFYAWAEEFELPIGKHDPSMINNEACQKFIDAGWISNTTAFNLANWFKKNWEKEVQITSQVKGDVWNISFSIDGKDFSCDLWYPFGEVYWDEY